MSKCLACGAEVQFNPEIQKVQCLHCGNIFDPEKLPQNQKKSIRNKSYLCTQCGAELLAFSDTAVSFCSYCGSQNILEKNDSKYSSPDYIIPFQKTLDECFNNYKTKVSNFLFTPSYFTSDVVLHKFRGIYMPYGIYNLSFNGDCVNKTELVSRIRGDYVYFDHYNIHADVDSKIEGISFDLMSDFYDEFSHSIPFDFHDALPYNENYLSGFYADSQDIKNETYVAEAKEIARSISTHYLLKDFIYTKYKCWNPVVKYKDVERKSGWFPVYFAAIRDKDNKYIHYAAINGQTGEVSAELPVDIKKYFLYSFILSLPIFFIVNLFGLIHEQELNIIILLISVIGMFIYANFQKNNIERKKRSDDKGVLTSLHKKKEKKLNFFKIDISTIMVQTVIFLFILLLPFAFLTLNFPKYGYYIVDIFSSISFYSLFFPIVYHIIKDEDISDKSKRKKILLFYLRFFIFTLPSFAIPVYLLMVNPDNPLFYYLGDVIALLFVLISFIDIIGAHNRLVARPIPQLEERGEEADA